MKKLTINDWKNEKIYEHDVNDDFYLDSLITETELSENNIKYGINIKNINGKETIYPKYLLQDSIITLK